MKFRMGAVVAGVLTVAAAACAGGGGAGGGGSAAPPTPAPTTEGAEELELGESPRNDEMTRAAGDALENAVETEEAGDSAAAQPFYESAAEAAEQAIQQDPTNPLPWLQGGRANIGLGNFEAADSMLSRATELRPIYELEIEPIRESTWIELYNAGQPLIGQGRLEEAVEYFEGAHALYKGRPEAMVVLGQIYAQLDRPEQGIDLLQQALDIINSEQVEEVDSATAAQWQQQADEVIPLTMTDLYIRSQQYQEAANMLNQLITEDPSNMVLQQNLASIYLELEQPDSARMIYEDMAAQPNLTGDRYFTIGAGFYNLDDYEAAADAFESAVEQSEYDRDAVELLARVLQLDNPVGEEQPQPSEETLERLMSSAERWVELDPYSVNAHLVAAQTAQRMGNQERANELARAAEALQINVLDLQLRRTQGGGATLTGQVRNRSLEPGASISMTFTFYGEDGTEIGRETVEISAPAEDAAEILRVPVNVDQYVAGYSYDADVGV